MQVVELIKQRLVEKASKEVFSLFTTLHDINVLQSFCILQVDFFPTCLQVQNFDSQQSREWMSMNLNLCQKPPLRMYILSNFSFERIFTYCSSLIDSYELFPI
jgi:hypothetical protein